MPSSVQARKMRMAISPRFADITFRNGMGMCDSPVVRAPSCRVGTRPESQRLLLALGPEKRGEIRATWIGSSVTVSARSNAALRETNGRSIEQIEVLGVEPRQRRTVRPI